MGVGVLLDYYSQMMVLVSGKKKYRLKKEKGRETVSQEPKQKAEAEFPMEASLIQIQCVQSNRHHGGTSPRWMLGIRPLEVSKAARPTETKHRRQRISI